MTNTIKFLYFALVVVSIFFLLSCSGSGGGEGDGQSGRDTTNLARGGSDAANFGCDGDCTNQNLTVADVTRILQQGVAGAQALGVAATIVVIDRPANVLAAYQMAGAPTTSIITSESGLVGGLQGGPLEGRAR